MSLVHATMLLDVKHAAIGARSMMDRFGLLFFHQEIQGRCVLPV
jgi:hypothetical protein